MDKGLYSDIPGMFVVPGEPQEVTDARAYILDAFKDLDFDEGPHKYTLGNKVLPSVTTILGNYTPPFDQIAISNGYAKKHPEKTAEGWRREWKWKNKVSTTTGTLVHEFGESLAYVVNGLPWKITDSCKSKYYPPEDWLIPTRSKEVALSKFWRDVSKVHSFHFLLSEQKLFTSEGVLKQQLAGTTDLLFYYIDDKNPDRKGIILGDYKTNSELKKDYSRSRNKMMLPPFDNYYDEPLSEYIAQLSIYQIPLEDLGFKIIDRRLIWLKDDETYEMVRTPDISSLIKKNL